MRSAPPQPAAAAVAAGPMLRRLALRDFVIVTRLELDFGAGFCALTGETGAGKSILVDALQLALGGRGDAGSVREGAARAEIVAEFDTPPALLGWLAEAGFDGSAGLEGRDADERPRADERAGEPLLLRRTLDAQGRSRAWINGSPATLAQLREAADALVDIHGQHAWQSLTRPAAVRALLDAQAGIDAGRLADAWQRLQAASTALQAARAQREHLERDRERLAWQIGELDKLAPQAGEWEQLEAEHRRAAHAQALQDGARQALAAISGDEGGGHGGGRGTHGEGRDGGDASRLLARALAALDEVSEFDAELGAVAQVLRDAQAQLDDAGHTLGSYLGRSESYPQRLAELDARLSSWLGLARRFRRAPEELPALLAQWQHELRALDAASDIDALAAALATARGSYDAAAATVSAARAKAAPRLAAQITDAMQQLGMAGGRFEVALLPQDEPQAFGRESVEFRVAGHAGSTPRPLAKVASGGELSRLALAIAVTTAGGAASSAPAAASAGEAHGASSGAGTLIFDEIDAGVGGSVADAVGRLMRELGTQRQVLAVTHLAQVAACADQHLLVAKAAGADGATSSSVRPVDGEAREAEIARMLGGSQHPTSLAHARELLAHGRAAVAPARRTTKPGAADDHATPVAADPDPNAAAAAPARARRPARS